MEIRSLSYSAISMFRECPWKFAQTYGLKVPRPIAEAALEGSLVHKVLEDWMPDRSKDWRVLLKAAYATAEAQYGNKREFAELTHEQYQGARDLLDAFTQRDDIKHVKPIAYETPFDITLPNGVPINGRIDRVDDEGDYVNFVDYKTTRSFIWRSEVEQSLQGAMYVLAGIYKLYPGRRYKFTIDALRYNPTTVEFSAAFLDATLDYLEVIYGDICKLDLADMGGIPQKPNKHCGFCPFRGECAAFAAAARTVYGEPLLVNLGDYARACIELDETERKLKKIRQSYESRIDADLTAQGKRHMDFGHAYVFYKEGRTGASLKIVDKSGGFLNEGD